MTNFAMGVDIFSDLVHDEVLSPLSSVKHIERLHLVSKFFEIVLMTRSIQEINHTASLRGNFQKFIRINMGRMLQR